MAAMIDRSGLRSSATAERTSPVATATGVNTPNVEVIDAKLQLTGKGQTQVDALYDTTVTKTTNVFSKFAKWVCFHFGKLSSTSAYGKAQAQDVAIKVASEDFNKATAELIKAAYFRNFTEVESKKLGIPTTSIAANSAVMNAHEQNRADNLNKAYEKASDKFCKAFNATLLAGDANPTAEKIKKFIKGAILALQDEQSVRKFARNGDELFLDTEKVSTGIFSSKKLRQVGLPDSKFEMIVTHFVDSTFSDAIHRFANQDVENITLESIHDEVKKWKQVVSGKNEREIIKSICKAVMENPAIVQAAEAAINAQNIDAAIAARSLSLQAEKEKILKRLAQLFQLDPASGAYPSILEGNRFEMGQELHKAWIAWQGYTTAGRASTNPGKVIISVDGNDVEVDGTVCKDNSKVSVYGTEELLRRIRIGFLNRLGTGALIDHFGHVDSGDSNERFASVVQSFDPAAASSKMLTAHEEAMTILKNNTNARNRFFALQEESEALEAKLADINSSANAEIIRKDVAEACNKRSDFLNIFIEKDRYGLNAATRRLTNLLGAL